ncbi:hypothetical protein [Devosia sp.]|uniref:hypothetical protein n=1 Tax=Devosia sp. TaxID=1871048 RepID=UPI0025E74FB2|nr:hypothetical protein [Devosia sp.]MCR6634913.1 hypothetical protein [Devosia sp.]
MTLLSTDSRIVRHVPGNKHQDGKVDGSVFVPLVDGDVFRLRQFEDGSLEVGLSVASLDLLEGADDDRLSKVRATFPKKLNKAQRFAELTVSGAISAVASKFADNADVKRLCALSLIHTPVGKEGEAIHFETHCDVLGLPLRTDAFSELVAEAISYSVTALHPALVVE